MEAGTGVLDQGLKTVRSQPSVYRVPPCRVKATRHHGAYCCETPVIMPRLGTEFYGYLSRCSRRRGATSSLTVKDLSGAFGGPFQLELQHSSIYYFGQNPANPQLRSGNRTGELTAEVLFC